MSSKAKQILLWLMIISSALLFVWFIQRTQTKNPQELSFDQAITRIEQKEIGEIYIKQDSVELT
ncbi:MAG TPA: ATP-dependent metallopeptidase FtsH/Yme1/Tma family protein, partial [Pyrinomonadaceae bacterium]